ncbi:MAG: type II secretion system F family protein [Acidimicrobiia bacterium]|nr:type II secretion system F family protein [Acidimicrobiia bacterium]
MPGVASVPRVVRGALALRRARREDARLRAEIPVAIDLIGVAAGAGCTPYLALETAAAWAPPAVAGHLGDVSRACSLGVSLADALAAKGRDVPLLRPLADALGATVRLGAPIGDALARLADEGRATLRREAETRARTMSVRLLFPLVLCVLPAFGLLTVVPAVLAGLRRV